MHGLSSPAFLSPQFSCRFPQPRNSSFTAPAFDSPRALTSFLSRNKLVQANFGGRQGVQSFVQQLLCYCHYTSRFGANTSTAAASFAYVQHTKMSNNYRVSLSYPNPSLGEMTPEEGSGSANASSSTISSGLRKHKVNKPRQVVLIISYASSSLLQY